MSDNVIIYVTRPRVGRLSCDSQIVLFSLYLSVFVDKWDEDD